LSIFVDESGDFGEYNHHSPYYIITMVFHNQNNDITEHIKKFNCELAFLGFESEHCVHNGPISNIIKPLFYLYNFPQRSFVI
jgi:hypothetical protein